MTMFEDVHADRIVGRPPVFGRTIFKGHLTRLYVPGAISAMLRRLDSPRNGRAIAPRPMSVDLNFSCFLSAHVQAPEQIQVRADQPAQGGVLDGS